MYEAAAWSLDLESELETKIWCHMRLPQRLNPGKPQAADLLAQSTSTMTAGAESPVFIQPSTALFGG